MKQTPFLLLIGFSFILFPLNGLSLERNDVPALSSDLILDGFDTDSGFTLSPMELEDMDQDRVYEFYVRSELLSSCWLKDIQTSAFQEDAFRVANMKLSFDLNLKLNYQGWTFFSDLDLNHDFSVALGASGQEEVYRRNIEKNAELKELWAEKNITPHIDLKTGRQIISWGVSNTLQLIDVLNPVDNRWIGMTDIEDRRLPVAMTRMAFYSEKTDLALVAVHEVRKNKSPVYGSPFYQEKTGMTPDKQASTFEHTQFGLSLDRHFRGMDAGIYLAGFFDQDAYRDVTTNNPGEYPFVKMAGTAGTIATGNFLIKAETAFFTGKKYTGARNPEKNRFDLLAGIEYSGFKDTTILVELLNRHIFDFESQMEAYGFEKDKFSSVLRVEKTFLNDTLGLVLLSSFDGFQLEDGGFLRLKAEYEYTDNLKFESGFIFYYGGENQYYETIKNNDIFFFKMIFDFNGF